ncbi:ABC-F family ATP-binding cassette domain-containing protein [Candidatus Saccharibacteria bacterium]|nr:ABC-F family ATP-binding cassette domain-containing protein [Candidatus Saccharibacteria bacterium]
MIELRSAYLSFGQQAILTGLDLRIHPGEKLALIGQNGSGKSTLLSVLAQTQILDQGSVTVRAGWSIGTMPQEFSGYLEDSCLIFLRKITGVYQAEEDLERSLERLVENTQQANQDYQDAADQVERLGVYDFDSRIATVIDQVGLGDLDLTLKLGQISGGQRHKLALASLLLSKKDCFLLDEPTNNLDQAGLKLLEDFLINTKAAIVFVSHDRVLLRKLANKILEFNQIDNTIQIYNTGYDNYLNSASQERQREAKLYKQYQSELEQLRGSIQGVKENNLQINQSGDSDKMADKARSDRAAKSQASGLKNLERRLEDLENNPVPKPFELEMLDLEFIPASRPAENLILAKKLVIKQGDFKLGPLDFSLNWGQKVVLTGENGVGKSSFIRTIIDRTKPDSGSLELSDNLSIGYIDQDQTLPDKSATVLENFALLTQKDQTRGRQYLAKLGFDDQLAQRPVLDLSPGQRARLLLAGYMVKGVNLLILDEPTNHIDIQTIAVLESAVKKFPGSALIITHDREFISNIRPDKLIQVESSKTNSFRELDQE